MTYNLGQLQKELEAAGFQTPNGMGTYQGLVHTFDDQGNAVPLPVGADAIVAQHKATRPMTAADYRGKVDNLGTFERTDIALKLLGVLPADMVSGESPN